MGKGLGNGYPVRAIAMTEDISERALAVHFHYAQSHQNDSLGCRVAHHNFYRNDKSVFDGIGIYIKNYTWNWIKSLEVRK